MAADLIHGRRCRQVDGTSLAASGSGTPLLSIYFARSAHHARISQAQYAHDCQHSMLRKVRKAGAAGLTLEDIAGIYDLPL